MTELLTWIYFILLLVLSSMFAAADQITRHKGFLHYLRLFPKGFYTWDLNFNFPFPWKADHFYQGAKIWILVWAIYVYPGNWLWLIVWMIGWWLVLRNVFLHAVLTRGWF